MIRQRVITLLAIALIALLWAWVQQRDAADQANDEKIVSVKAEFRRRIAAKWPGYEQIGSLSSPIAIPGDHDRLEHP